MSSDENKLSLSGRGTLGVGKGRETGKVRQNFSHGRSKAVVVERRKKRSYKKSGETETAQPSEQETPAQPQFQPKRPQAERHEPHEEAKSEERESGRGLTSAEELRRREAYARLEEEQRRAEEERQRVEEEARKRAEEERRRKAEEEAMRRAAAAERGEDAETAEDAAEAQPAGDDVESPDQSDEQARRLAEEAAKRAAEDKQRKKAEAEARKKSEEEERAREEARKKAEKESKKPRKRAGEDEESKRGKARARDEGGRRAGKLSVTRALEGEEEERRRSEAAFRRAQAKRKAAQQGEEGAKQPREVVIPEVITVQELANRMAEKASNVIKTLMQMGVMATINENLDQDTAELVVTELGHQPKRVSESDVEIGLTGEEDRPEDMKPRPPVVTVMGHVDHGKTTLLDAVRETDVVAGEAGGITQHIGAYQIEIEGGQRITFLDTPGHEAFTQMRARGAGLTDIVVLVVAADDGIKPQTIEAINHAKAAEVPLLVAINKIDLPGADPDRVRQELLQHDVQVESMGGDVVDVEVSAAKRENLDKLAEMLALQAELLELKANPDRAAEGVVVEAKLEKGRGPVATVLIRRGTLRVGDIFVTGPEWGRVRAMVDERGQSLETAEPARPVEILGLSGPPSAGDDFAVVDNEARAREVSEYRQEEMRRKRQRGAPTSLEGMFSKLKEEQVKELPLVVKGDVQGSVEAIIQALEQVGNEEIRAQILHAAAGGITETDVTLAAASDATIIGFNVRANKQAREAAERDGVNIQYYSVIYQLIDDVKAAMAGELGPAIEETTLGWAEVRDVFRAGKAGKAAGCQVLEGVVRRGAEVRLLRDDVVVYTGRLTSLRRFKDDVDEVKSGTECGMTFENFQDVKVGDQVEVFESREVERQI